MKHSRKKWPQKFILNIQTHSLYVLFTKNKMYDSIIECPVISIAYAYKLYTLTMLYNILKSAQVFKKSNCICMIMWIISNRVRMLPPSHNPETMIYDWWVPPEIAKTSIHFITLSRCRNIAWQGLPLYRPINYFFGIIRCMVMSNISNRVRMLPPNHE